MPTSSIVIDARTLGRKPSGIGIYTLNLLRGIGATALAADLGPMTAWVRPEVLPTLPAALRSRGALRLVAMPGGPGTPWTGRGAGVGRETLLHVPDVFAPLVGPARRVVTLHDVIPLVCRGELARSRKQRFLPAWRAWLKLQTRRAAAVVTVSDYSARDIVRELGVPREKITVIHNAVDAAGVGDVRAGGGEGLAIPFSRFVLNVGRRDPYKNVPGLVRAFARMRAADPGLADVGLVVVGPRDPRYPEAEAEVRRLGLGDAVKFVGYVEHEELERLYRGAALVAVPSRYEGFGLPLAEGMRAGVPVVCSDRSCLPEVAGGAALLVDPDDEVAFAGAMARVLGDRALAVDLGRRGRERAAAFGLAAFGAAHLALYARLGPDAGLR